jgi:LysM repeat protein
MRLSLDVRWIAVVAGMVAALAAVTDSRLAGAQSTRVYELLDEVNALRASYGLAAFVVDPILMAVAQQSADCGAAAGGLSHTCVGGMRPRDRAIAAGYGAGETVFVSENIIEGSGLAPAQAVEWWTGDDPHLNTMIGQYYRDVGAGYAEVDGYAFYVLMSGYVAGGYSATGYYTPATLTAAAAPPPPVPVVIATPSPDGSIVHMVEYGQSLWTIAAVYGVDVETLRQLNGFPAEPLLHQGDRVVIRGPQSTVTTEPAATVEQASATGMATIVESGADAAVAPDEESGGEQLGSLLRPALIGAGVILVLLGVVYGLRRP